MLNQGERDGLETLIDRYDIGDVIEALAGICAEKADHVQENWQDRRLANLWTRRAGRLGKLAASDTFATVRDPHSKRTRTRPE